MMLEPLYFSNTEKPETDYSNMLAYGKKIESFLPLGLPPDPMPKTPPPGLESTIGAIPSAGWTESLENAWNGIVSSSESAVQGLYESGKKVVRGVYEDAKDAAGDVYDDLTKPVGSLLDNVYWKVILAVVVVGGVVYFAGKSGALRISR